MSRYNTANNMGKNCAIVQFNKMIEKKAIIDIIEIKNKRTNLQNSALWKYCTIAADALNDIGFYNKIPLYTTGEEIEVKWNKKAFKEKIWMPVQYQLFNTESTTEMKINQVSQVYEPISQWLATMGIDIAFPSINNKINDNDSI